MSCFVMPTLAWMPLISLPERVKSALAAIVVLVTVKLGKFEVEFPENTSIDYEWSEIYC